MLKKGQMAWHSVPACVGVGVGQGWGEGVSTSYEEDSRTLAHGRVPTRLLNFSNLQ
jgi:hypothetical protein